MTTTVANQQRRINLANRGQYRQIEAKCPGRDSEIWKEVAKLKRRPGKNMVMWGSISLAQSLLKEDLIDEYRLVMCPVVLGSGRPLFLDKVDSFGLKLVEAKTFDRGAVQLKYKPASVKKTSKKRAPKR
jgi:dihydrofolate reductase